MLNRLGMLSDWFLHLRTVKAMISNLAFLPHLDMSCCCRSVSCRDQRHHPAITIFMKTRFALPFALLILIQTGCYSQKKNAIAQKQIRTGAEQTDKYLPLLK